VSTQRARSAARARARRRLLEELYPRPVLCAIRWDERCTGLATDPHEPLTRARGGSITDPANIVPACRACHDAAHAHPAEAERRGWLIPSSH
jgi:hypothetical protein